MVPILLDWPPIAGKKSLVDTMQRQLILFSHGKADSNSGIDDHQQPLKDRYKREAQLFGSWLQQSELTPDHVLSSPSRPAMDSAEYACNVMGLGINAITVEEEILKADKKSLLSLLTDCPDDIQRLLLVGQASLLEKLLQFLSSKKIKAKGGRLLPESSVAILQLDVTWSKLNSASASLLSLTATDKLPRKFPFVNSDNVLEWRDRPAYYYSQSAVIPYRIHNGQTEILLITSSSNKRWIIPKGVIEIGMTPQASAAKEAYEEAGVLGRVGHVLLGTYTQQKWGAECHVQVYPMQVTEMIPQQQRLEPDRQRCWMTPQEAASCLKQKALLPMIVHLTEQLMLTGSI